MGALRSGRGLQTAAATNLPRPQKRARPQQGESPVGRPHLLQVARGELIRRAGPIPSHISARRVPYKREQGSAPQREKGEGAMEGGVPERAALHVPQVFQSICVIPRDFRRVKIEARAPRAGGAHGRERRRREE